MIVRKIIILILSPFILLGIFYPGVFANTFLYYFNGAFVKIDNYTINFPLTHWALFSKSENGFEISGRRIDSISLEATIHEFDKPLSSVLASFCDDLVYEEKQFEIISLNMYTCILQNNKKTIYLQTLDNKLVLETHTYIKNNKSIVSEFDLLLNAIEP